MQHVFENPIQSETYMKFIRIRESKLKYWR